MRLTEPLDRVCWGQPNLLVPNKLWAVRRRDEWTEAGVMDALEEMVIEPYHRIIRLQHTNVAVDSCITKALCGGDRADKSPVDRGKLGIKRSNVLDAQGIPLGVVTAPANRHDSPLLTDTLDTLEAVGPMPERVSVHLDRVYDSNVTRERLKDRGLVLMISKKGKPAPLQATKRWGVERTNAHKKLVWCTERRGQVIDFWIAFSNVIIMRRLIREAWTRYLWDTRLCRRP